MTQTHKPKLIEVALPLAAINVAGGKEGSIGARPHPKNLHRWWARRPLSVARAILWASLIDDPSTDGALSKEEQDKERQRLFAILERLVAWNATMPPDPLAEAQAEIDRCFPEGPPSLVDPFGGGGAIPLEGQRLGLSVTTGDLNPVAVILQKSLLELPMRFAGSPPVHPETSIGPTTWERAQGLAADVEAYGIRVRDEAWRRVGTCYPRVTDPTSGAAKTPIAWIWARTVESSDPSWSGHVPLVASWTLCSKKGKQRVWIEPVVDRSSQTISYEIREGGQPDIPRTVDQGNGTCIATGAAMPYDYIRAEAAAGRMGSTLMAVVVADESGKRYLPAGDQAAVAASASEPAWKPNGKPSHHPRNISTPPFGFDQWWKHFTPRQLLTLTSIADLICEVRSTVESDAVAAGMADDGVPVRDGGSGATAYADAVSTYLTLALSRQTDFCNAFCSWNSPNEQIRYLFSDQRIPMVWDYVESNPFSGVMGSWDAMISSTCKAIDTCLGYGSVEGNAEQMDARARLAHSVGSVVSTDPPYYDNISYADLSDFFFVWLRRCLGSVWPDECATLSTPKEDELIANRYRAGSAEAADSHFESGMAEVMHKVAEVHHSDVPATIYYAHKASESKNAEAKATGWASFLQAVLDSGLQVTATWPVRTERRGRQNAIGANALASSIVLVCRRRSIEAPLASSGEFLGALRDELPAAVHLLQTGNIAPVDIAQSTIGPGIKVFSRYSRVVRADGSTMRVAEALELINDVLGEILDGESAELDSDTRFAVTWYSQHAFAAGSSGDADAQARPKGTSIEGLEAAGIAIAQRGSFRLLRRDELDAAWDPARDSRLTVWEATQYLIAALERSESEAGALLHQLGGYAERARSLAYVLFKKASDTGSAEEAAAYNNLIDVWASLLESGHPADDAQQRLV